MKFNPFLDNIVEVLWLFSEEEIHHDIVTIDKLAELIRKAGYSEKNINRVERLLVLTEYLFEGKYYTEYDEEPEELESNERGLNHNKIFIHLIEGIQGENLARRYIRKMGMIYGENKWNILGAAKKCDELRWEFESVKKIEMDCVDELVNLGNVPTWGDILEYAKQGYCYRNAINTIKEYSKDILYVEGYSFYDGILIPHAWNKIGDKYFDVTAEAWFECVTKYPYKFHVKEPNCQYFTIMEIDIETLEKLARMVNQDRPFADGAREHYYNFMVKNKK